LPFYEKHSIECMCVHPTMREVEPVVVFAFPVITEITKKGLVKKKTVKCPNCDRIHNVYEIGKSEIVNYGSYLELDDVKRKLPNSLVNILDEHGCDFVTYEECELALRRKVKNNKKVVLTREFSDGEVFGKCVLLSKKGKFVVESYKYNSRSEVVFNE
jgi:ssDNA-binding Zn-finger/Zn-ribbon topoisomerase 1